MAALGKDAARLIVRRMDDLSERLFAHFVAGRWRVPYSTRQMPVTGLDGLPLGQIVLAGPQDIARARALLRAADPGAASRLADLIMGEADHIAGAQAMADAMRAASQAQHSSILCCDARNPVAFGTALGASLGQGVIWCPPPEAALAATRIARLVQAANLSPGAFALLHAYTPETAQLLRATGLPMRTGV